MTNVKPPLTLKNRFPAIITFPSAGIFTSFLKKKTHTQNQSHRIDERAHGEHFQPKISHKTLTTYPLTLFDMGGGGHDSS